MRWFRVRRLAGWTPAEGAYRAEQAFQALVLSLGTRIACNQRTPTLSIKINTLLNRYPPAPSKAVSVGSFYIRKNCWCLCSKYAMQGSNKKTAFRANTTIDAFTTFIDWPWHGGLVQPSLKHWHTRIVQSVSPGSYNCFNLLTGLWVPTQPAFTLVV